MDGTAAAEKTTSSGQGALHWSSAWVVDAVEESLVLSAGPDRHVAVDGLDRVSREAAQRWQAEGGPVVADNDIERQLVDRLVALGALSPVLGPSWSLRFVGDSAASEELARLLEPGASADPARSPRPDDLVVVLRTGPTWPDPPDEEIHLGLDLALHHTVVLGPLVIPGASACLGCLDTHVARRWPTRAMPERPAALGSLAVAAALLQVQAELVAGGTSPLVNATIAWDLERGTTDRQPLYKVNGCTRCDPGRWDGRVTLPWEVAR